MNLNRVISMAVAVAFVIAALAGCVAPSASTTSSTTPNAWNPVDAPVDGYVTVAPNAPRAGQSESIAVSLFAGQRPAIAKVQLALLQNGQSVAEAVDTVPGQGEVALSAPQPESVSFKPSLPLSLLVVAETPDKKPVASDAYSYYHPEWKGETVGSALVVSGE